jgi:phosphoribosylaminoimidazole-succinocarboxamide synthase
VQISYKGKVRDVYDLGSTLILSSSDRISAFDVVFEELITGKGIILNQISNSWFHFFSEIKNHIIETDHQKFPEPFQSDEFKDRSVLVKKCKRIDYECVVRGYLSGSAFKEYTHSKTIANIPTNRNYLESEKLSEPIFTPAVKNDSGHDENISEVEMENRVGKELFQTLKNRSLEIYISASKKVESVGLILCDTKFEFGIWEDEVILIDELLTPDSSRYWDIETYSTGSSPPSFDKQVLRNYLETLTWDKNPPAPKLPPELIKKILQKYTQLQEKINLCLSQK